MNFYADLTLDYNFGNSGLFSAYSSTSNEYDISLMRFDAVTFGSLIRSISLPTSTAESLSINRDFCSISGWGATTGKNSNSQKSRFWLFFCESKQKLVT